MYPSRSNRQEQFVTHLPWAGSLESNSAAKSPDSPDRPANPDSHAGPASRLGTATLEGLPSPPRPLRSDGADGRPRAGSHPDSGAPGQPAALGQAISNRLFSAGFDLDFVMMTRHDEPGVRRLEHAITEIDDAIKDLRHLMVAIMQRLA
jgi:hypothetical protein